MATQTSDFGNAASDLSGAVSSLFGARGATAAADSYLAASAIAEQNAQLTKQETDIKETQQTRQIFQTIGKQQAAIAGAGFGKSGTAIDLMRSSASQGALAKAMTADQGAITENSYAEQSGMFKGMADAAKSSSTAQTIGGVLQTAGGLFNLAKGANNLLGNPAGKLFSSGSDPAFDVGQNLVNNPDIFGSAASTLGSDFAFDAGANLVNNPEIFGAAADAIGTDTAISAAADVAGIAGDFIPGVGWVLGAYSVGKALGLFGGGKESSVLQGFKVNGSATAGGFSGQVTAFDQLGHTWDATGETGYINGLGTGLYQADFGIPDSAGFLKSLGSNSVPVNLTLGPDNTLIPSTVAKSILQRAGLNNA